MLTVPLCFERRRTIGRYHRLRCHAEIVSTASYDTVPIVLNPPPHEPALVKAARTWASQLLGASERAWPHHDLGAPALAAFSSVVDAEALCAHRHKEIGHRRLISAV